jgi:3-deoxy-manno-octulosonate cytidylyltransferase (CMP-KDO synthetase)
MTEFHVIIPARYGSIRLPAKALLSIAGKPLIQHVHRRAVESGATSVTVATDDDRIRIACEEFGASVCMTREDHQSGTDRLAECVELLKFAEQEIVVNLQGDEPLTPPSALHQVAESLEQHQGSEISTLCVPIQDAKELHSPHAVKVLRDARGFAQYFSRAVIPWHRDEFASDPGSLPDEPVYLRHIGIYGYRVGFLRKYSELTPAPEERAESLEQLRALHHGARIYVAICEHRFPPGVDIQEDIERVERALLAS